MTHGLPTFFPSDAIFFGVVEGGKWGESGFIDLPLGSLAKVDEFFELSLLAQIFVFNQEVESHGKHPRNRTFGKVKRISHSSSGEK